MAKKGIRKKGHVVVLRIEDVIIEKDEINKEKEGRMECLIRIGKEK